jgi:hypothetical protein
MAEGGWGSPIKRHLSREKNNPSARNSVFFLGTRRLREWAAKWLVGAAAHLIDSFAPEPISPNALRKSPFLFLTQDDPYEVTNLSPFAVVSFGFAVSVLTAPVTHQDLGLQQNRLSSATPSVLNGPENLRFQAVSKWCLSGRMVVSQPLVAHGVGGQDADDLVRSGWNG